MGRLCERPGCSAPAAVLYAIDAEHLTVWIDSIERSDVLRGGVLCRRHADAMVVPMGWTLDDRRDPELRLFKSARSEPSAPKPRKPRAPRAAPSVVQLQLDETPAPPRTRRKRAPAAAAANGASKPEGNGAVSAAEADEASPWKPIFDQSDDLDGLLEASGPLLQRAFGKRPRPDD